MNLKQWRLPELAFLLSTVLVIFGSGIVVARLEVFPYPILEAGWNSLRQVVSEREMLMGTRPTEFLEPARYAGDGVTKWSAAEAAPGLTLLTGFFEGGNQLRLVRNDGTVVRKWSVSYQQLFPSSAHIQPQEEVPRSDWNAGVHGATILPDGSIIFHFTYKGSARLDRCGTTQWTLPQMTHHSVERAADGSFWVPNSHYVTEGSPFPFLHMPYVEDTLAKVSGSGEVIMEISVEEVLFKNNLQGVLHWKRGTGDMTHVNDVEELSPEMATHFPMFAAGDLLVSMRMQHMIFVMDPTTLAVKWYQAGPWLGQHDPDFLPSGRILVFNNNDDGKGGSWNGGSNIMEVDPKTHAVWYRYGVRPDQRMFTHERGKHQPLDGEHILITEANAGRAFEVDKDGRIVWEFVNRYDDKDAALLTEATRYPESYFTVSDWSCR